MIAQEAVFLRSLPTSRRGTGRDHIDSLTETEVPPIERNCGQPHQRVLKCLTGLFTPSLLPLASIESTV